MSKKNFALDFGTSTIQLAVIEGDENPSNYTWPTADKSADSPLEGESLSSMVLKGSEGAFIAGSDAKDRDDAFSPKWYLSLPAQPKPAEDSDGEDSEREMHLPEGLEPLVLRTEVGQKLARKFREKAREDIEQGLVASLKNAVRLGSEIEGGPDFEKDVIRMGCPASWDAERRRLLVQAAKQAGIKHAKVSELREEPVGGGFGILNAAMQVGRLSLTEEPKDFLVLDVGGGTADVAVIRLRNVDSGDIEVRVLASAANSHAGITFDHWLRAKLADNNSLDESHIALADVERAKIQFVRGDGGDASIPLKDKVQDKPIKLTGEVLNAELRPFVQSALNLGREVLGRASLITATFGELDALGKWSDTFGSSNRDVWLSSGDDGQDSRNKVRNFNRWSTLASLSRFDVSKAAIDGAGTGLRGQFVASLAGIVLVGGMSMLPLYKEMVEEAFPGVEIFDDPIARPLGITAVNAVSQGLGAVKLGVADLKVFVSRPPYGVHVRWYENEKGQVVPRSEQLLPPYSWLFGEGNAIDSRYSHFGSVASLRAPSAMSGSALRDEFKDDESSVRLNGSVYFQTADGAEVPLIIEEGDGSSKVHKSYGVILNSARPLHVKLYGVGLMLITDSDLNQVWLAGKWSESGQEVRVVGYQTDGANNFSQSIAKRN